jgi:hypothetical protein
MKNKTKTYKRTKKKKSTEWVLILKYLQLRVLTKDFNCHTGISREERGKKNDFDDDPSRKTIHTCCGESNNTTKDNFSLLHVSYKHGGILSHHLHTSYRFQNLIFFY